MAASVNINRRRNSKFCDRLDIQERFRINLESIINKYDKPFEDSPILDLNEMSATTAESIEALTSFQPFGWTSLLTDLKKGKKRKGGVSCDSALGSTRSSDLSSTGESKGNIPLEDFDFTHETSDAMGAFIRYKHHSKLKAPEIAGLNQDGNEYSESSDLDSEDDIGSVCSGPTVAPFPAEKSSEREEDIIGDTDRTREDSDSQNKRTVPRDAKLHADDQGERDETDKVRSWLSDDAFVNTRDHVNIENDVLDDSVSEMELSQQSGCYYSSTASEGEEIQMRYNNGESLLQVKEMFVRRVKSILVEGNNETDDMSSSADEGVCFIQGVPVAGDDKFAGSGEFMSTDNQKDPSQLCERSGARSNSSRRLFAGPSCSGVFYDTSSALQSDHEEASKEESIILAGHFDESHLKLPTKVAIKTDEKFREARRKEFELVQSPSGKIEWTTSSGGKDSSKIVPACGQQQAGAKVEVSSLVVKPDHVTPQKPILGTVNTNATQRIFKTPLSGSKASSKGIIQANRCAPENKSIENSQNILSEIMDFFKSPLPQLLNSPMPLLSPRGKFRTAQGRRVTRSALSKSEDVDSNLGKLDVIPLQWSKSPRSEIDVSHTVISTAKAVSPQHFSRKSVKIFEKDDSTAVKSNKCFADDTWNTKTGVDGRQERHWKVQPTEQLASTDDEGDISLLTEESSDAQATPKHNSKPKLSGVLQSPKTPTKLHDSTKKLVSVSKTPSITSPFSRMDLKSGGKAHSDNGRKQDKERRSSVGISESGPAKGLAFDNDGSQDLEMLSFSSSGDDDDEELEGLSESGELQGKCIKLNSAVPLDAKRNCYMEDILQEVRAVPSDEIVTNHFNKGIPNRRMVTQGTSSRGRKIVRDTKRRNASHGSDDQSSHESIELLSDGCIQGNERSPDQSKVRSKFETTYVITVRPELGSSHHQMQKCLPKEKDHQCQSRSGGKRPSISVTQPGMIRTRNERSASGRVEHKQSNKELHATSPRTKQNQCAAVPTLRNFHGSLQRTESEQNHTAGTRSRYINSPKNKSGHPTAVSSQSGHTTDTRTADRYSKINKSVSTSVETKTMQVILTKMKSDISRKTSTGDDCNLASRTEGRHSSVSSNERRDVIKLGPKNRHSCDNQMEHASTDVTADRRSQGRRLRPAGTSEGIDGDLKLKRHKRQNLQSPRNFYKGRSAGGTMPVTDAQQNQGLAGKDVSFLSSTRIDDTCDFENGGSYSPVCSSSEGTMQRIHPSQERKSKELAKRRDALSSPSSLFGKRDQKVERGIQKKQDVASHGKYETPSKRRRQGSDRANSLELPAKRRTPVGAKRKNDSSPGEGRTRGGTRRLYDSPKESGVLTKAKTHKKSCVDIGGDYDYVEQEIEEIRNRGNRGARFSSSSCPQRSPSGHQTFLSVSSMCEGPGLCTKKICFKCAMNESGI